MRGGAGDGAGFSRAVVYKQAQEEIGRWLEENRLPGYPLFYTTSARFLNGSEPSSERGSLARMQIPLSNFPHAVFGVVATNFYELSEAAADKQPDYYQRMKLGGIDDAQTIHVSLTQQNVTQTPAPQNVFSGGTGNVWRPWPTIYWFRAANQVVIEARRLVRYPSILLDSGARFLPLPEIHVTMVTAQLNSDYFPGSMPGSTGRP